MKDKKSVPSSFFFRSFSTSKIKFSPKKKFFFVFVSTFSFNQILNKKYEIKQKSIFFCVGSILLSQLKY